MNKKSKNLKKIVKKSYYENWMKNIVEPFCVYER